MTAHVHNSHRIVVDAPVERCFMFFTPAGEALWVGGWQPRYLHPADGTTAAGMVFTTGHGDESTIWLLADFDRAAHRSRYVRVTPGSRAGFVEVQCRAIGEQRTEVTVSYTLTALDEQGAASLRAYEGAAFVAMIDEWAAQIAARRELLLAATIR